MKEEILNVVMASNKIKCLKCKFGLIVNPYESKCARYKQVKPYEIYFEGKDCPMFEEAILNK